MLAAVGGEPCVELPFDLRGSCGGGGEALDVAAALQVARLLEQLQMRTFAAPLLLVQTTTT